jgi:hypothetical protein
MVGKVVHGVVVAFGVLVTLYVVSGTQYAPTFGLARRPGT